MRAGVAFDDKPLPTTQDVLPEFAMQTRRIRSHINVAIPGLEVRIIVGRSRDGGVAAITELVMVAWAAVGTIDAKHELPIPYCSQANGPAPASSSVRPVRKRSRL